MVIRPDTLNPLQNPDCMQDHIPKPQWVREPYIPHLFMRPFAPNPNWKPESQQPYTPMFESTP